MMAPTAWADHPGQAGQGRATAEHAHEDPRHVVAQGLDHLGMGERRLDHQAHPGACQQQPERQQHEQGNQHDEAPRARELGLEQGEERALQLGRQAVGHGGATPDQLHHLEDDEGQAEGDEQLGHMAELVHPAQGKAFEQRAQAADGQGRQHQGRPEVHHAGDAVAQVGAHHVEAGVGEVEHPHHAEDEGEPGTQHEEQQPVADPVEQGDDEGFEGHGGRARGGPAPPEARATRA
jgi:hypothetical protein